MEMEDADGGHRFTRLYFMGQLMDGWINVIEMGQCIAIDLQKPKNTSTFYPQRMAL